MVLLGSIRDLKNPVLASLRKLLMIKRENQITLQKTGFTSSSFSPKLPLVPIVQPPKGVVLPYKILFKISSMVQHGCIPWLALNVYFFRLVDPQRRNIACIEQYDEYLRPHPNECSGSDLDGDIYFVCWDQDLSPPRQVQAMDYSPAPSTELDHDVTIEDNRNYIVNDSLGIVANAHVVVADREPELAMSDPCKELAQLFSIAVDFPKTGVPAEVPSRLRPKEYLDFMEKPDKQMYYSERVIGKLFRKVKDKAPQSSSIATFTRDVASRSYDADLEVDGFEDYIDEAFDYKTEYDNKLGNLMDYYGIKREAEILSGGIMKASKTFDRRRDAEAIGVAVRSLRKEARTCFKRHSDIDDMLAKASAWYHVIYHPRYWGCNNQGLKRDHFISFPWRVYDQLIQIKKEKARNRPVLHLSSLGHQLSRMELI
ncbi:RNA-dependent RNA polymerase 1-like [Lycium barbarum]|uniref:RNA-dependent RNA polymerase 1-like n=1 Tax=Lycium barbarum TaxID=112863 RepID=UPI00293F10DB|nr:RNA-dependent RNA polymerase 1-like [Lycium barbarum]